LGIHFPHQSSPPEKVNRCGEQSQKVLNLIAIYHLGNRAAFQVKMYLKYIFYDLLCEPAYRMDTQQNLYDRIGGRDGLARLLRHFNPDVRQHALLGPIFNQQIEDWPAHLEKIGSFWARLTGGPSGYSGQMPLKHLHIGIEAPPFHCLVAIVEF
jgi:hypothetical protein